MNLSKFKFAFKRDGIIGFLNILIGKLGLKFRFHTALDKRKLWLIASENRPYLMNWFVCTPK